MNLFEKLRFDAHVRDQEASYIVQGSVFVQDPEYRAALLQRQEDAFKGKKTRQAHYDFCKAAQALLIQTRTDDETHKTYEDTID